MNCFNHPTMVALGTCKACSKGLCQACAVDMGHGLSCKGEHEATVQAYHDMLKRNERALAAAPRNIILAPVFFAFMGVVFMIWGLSSPHGVKDFTFILGCGFLAFGALAYRQARRSLILGDTKRSDR
jgi:hypothetical protein